MARPLNVRSRYGRDEQTTGDLANAGVSGAIDDYLKEQDAQRTEANDMAAHGGVPVGSPPTAGDRFNGVKRAVGRVFGRGGPPTMFSDDTRPLAPTPAGPPPVSSSLRGAPSFASAVSAGPLSEPPVTPPAPVRPMAPQRPMAPPPISSAMTGSPMYQQQQGATDPGFVRRPSDTGATDPGFRASGNGGIASALSESMEPKGREPDHDVDDLSYMQRGRNGQQYKFDPMREPRAKAQFADRERATRESDQIQSLVDAGMPAAEARARVKNNIVRYDETFGPQKTTGAGALSFAQRQQLQTQRDAAAFARARLAESGKQNTAEYRDLMLQIQVADLKIRQAELRAAGFEKEAAALEGQIPKGVDLTVATSTPLGAAAVDSTRRAASAARDSSVAARTAGATAPVPVVPTRTRTPFNPDAAAGTHTKPPVAERDQQLIAAGKTKAERLSILKSEGYNVR